MKSLDCGGSDDDFLDYYKDVYDNKNIKE